MKELYTVGEIAKIFNVSSDTFRFYDKQGVIKPWEVGANGYRYYHKAQFELINTVLLLRSAGTPLERLPQIFGAEDTRPMEKELEKHASEIGRKIEHLKNLELRVQHVHETIRDARSEYMRIERIPALWLLSRDFESAHGELALEDMVATYRMTDSSWIHFANTFSTISQKNLYNRSYQVYRSYGFISEYPCNSKSTDLSCIENQLFATATAQSKRVDLIDIYPVYDKLKLFIQEQGYQVAGDTIERNIVDLYAEKSKQFTHHFKLYVPVAPNQ